MARAGPNAFTVCYPERIGVSASFGQFFTKIIVAIQKFKAPLVRIPIATKALPPIHMSLD
jgi:hypothetical protein